MAKKKLSASETRVKSSEVKLPVKEKAESLPAAPKRSSQKVSVRSLWPGKVVVHGDNVPSGKSYVFPGAGAVVDVAEEDVRFLLARRRRVGCCGTGVTEEPFFELA